MALSALSESKTFGHATAQDVENMYNGSERIESKERGTVIDQRDMQVLGKKQVLRVGLPIAYSCPLVSA